MVRKAILDYDATTLREKLQTRELTAVEATKAYIHQIKTVNPHINAVVENRFAEALAEAQAADELLKTGQGEGLLLGVPVSMKESFHVSGMKTTGGLLQRREVVVHEDAVPVARLRREGAIILGKTNTPTLCFCQESVNKLYGRTNNPWDIERTAGGSSGGEGALIAVGGAAVGFGSDIGGSIRFPAHFNGIIGFKSGNSQVSDQGHFPATFEPLQKRMLGMGAMAKSVADAELINKIVAEQQPLDIESEKFQLTVFPSQTEFPLGEDTKDLLRKIGTSLAQDYSVDDELPGFFNSLSLIWQMIMSYEGEGNMITTTFAKTKFNPLWEYIKEVFAGKSDFHAYFTWAIIGAGLFRPTEKKINQLRWDLEQIDLEAKTYFANRVLILPTFHTTALPHGQVFSQIFSIRKTFLHYMPYIALANVLGLPVLTIPVGTDSQGLPIGVQLITATGNEKALFHFGRQLEGEFGGYQRCTEFDG